MTQLSAIAIPNAATARVKRWSKGLSLIEAAMVLALSAVVVAGTMFYYQSASQNQKTEASQSELMALNTIVRSLYGSRSNFSGVTAQQVISTNHLPPSLVDKTNNVIKNPFGGTVDVGEDASGQRFYMTFDKIPKGPCIKIGVTRIGSSVYELSINGHYMGDGPGQALTYCTSQDDNVIKWIMR